MILRFSGSLIIFVTPSITPAGSCLKISSIDRFGKDIYKRHSHSLFRDDILIFECTN